MDLSKVMQISAAGMDAEGTRLKTIAENMANANSVAPPGGQTYRRKLVTFQDTLDHASGLNLVQAKGVEYDQSPLPTKYDPGNPSANPQGYVEMPNVNTLIEAMDMRESQRSYEANLDMVDVSKSMLVKTINLLQN
jgi:flagellar basal-body rod protein FlgC